MANKVHSRAGGTVYVAPEAVHLGVSDEKRIHLIDAPQVGGFRPSGNVLLASTKRKRWR